MKKEIKVLGLVVVAVLFSTQLAYAGWTSPFKSFYKNQLCPVGRGFKAAGTTLKTTAGSASWWKGPAKNFLVKSVYHDRMHDLAYNKVLLPIGREFKNDRKWSESFQFGSKARGGNNTLAREKVGDTKPIQGEFSTGFKLSVQKQKTTTITSSSGDKTASPPKNPTGLIKKYTVGGLDFWANY